MNSSSLSELLIVNTDIDDNYGSSAIYTTDAMLTLKTVNMRGNVIRDGDYPSLPQGVVQEVSSEQGGAALYCEGRYESAYALLVSSNVENSTSITGAAAVFGRYCRLDIVQTNVTRNVGPRGAVVLFGDTRVDVRTRFALPHHCSARV